MGNNASIRIYQIDSKRDVNRVKFESLDRLELYQGHSNVDPSIYDVVFDGSVDASNIEDIYYVFNMHHPANYRGHSLSVSDVVEIISSKDIPKGFYYCDDFGFKTIEFDTKN